jgi:protocatechuate 4,5-dioxygenase alpha chain
MTAIQTIDAASATKRIIPGTPIFDGDAAVRGYALNAMCYAFNDADIRSAFVADEDACFDRFQLTDEQRDAVRSRNVLRMIEVGGNIYYLAKLAGILGLNVQDLGAQQTGMSVEAFRQMLRDAAHQQQEA